MLPALAKRAGRVGTGDIRDMKGSLEEAEGAVGLARSMPAYYGKQPPGATPGIRAFDFPIGRG